MRSTQRSIILGALQEARGGWVSALHLHQLTDSLAVHSRVADLRRRVSSLRTARITNAAGQSRNIGYSTPARRLGAHFRPLSNSERRVKSIARTNRRRSNST